MGKEIINFESFVYLQFLSVLSMSFQYIVFEKKDNKPYSLRLFASVAYFID